METKYGFTKMDVNEFENYISSLKIARTIVMIQQHHTYIPSYIHFNGKNHFELQKGMKNTHINVNGWSDIGQHISIFPDGSVVTGRNFEKSPACIYGNNANAFCIENVGNFDKGADEMGTKQREAIISVTTSLCRKFCLTPNTNTIVYHHWYNLSNGVRNNGAANNKSCPGTNFFGGNKVEACKKHFIPLISERFAGPITMSATAIIKYVSVTSKTLNIRTGPSLSKALLKSREPALFGGVLRVYEEQNGWYRISSSGQHWISAKFTTVVKKALVNVDTLNMRSGAGSNFPKIGALLKGSEVFIYNEEGNWSQISIDQRWVANRYLIFDK
jgi:N-acetylmuramoyl-L-alanine amidase./Bacterial SH3 domain.